MAYKEPVKALTEWKRESEPTSYTRGGVYYHKYKTYEDRRWKLFSNDPNEIAHKKQERDKWIRWPQRIIEEKGQSQDILYSGYGSKHNPLSAYRPHVMEEPRVEHKAA